MNPEGLHNALIYAIKSKIPGDQIASKISDIICLGKEAVYRRLRGDVHFTFNEVALIAQKLKISLDEIIGYTDEEYMIFHFRNIRYVDIRDKDIRMIDSIVDLLKNVDCFTNIEVGYAVNRIPSFLLYKYENLAKVITMKWLYQFDGINKMRPFHDIQVDPRQKRNNEEFALLIDRVPQSYCIIDRAVFYFLKNDLDTFMELNYIRAEDLQKVKDELLLLLDELEEIAERGAFPNGNKIDICISDTNLDALYGYIESDQFKEAFVGAFSLNCVIARDLKMFGIIKNTVHTLKHVATHISGSGVRQRVQYFREQRQVVESIDDIINR